ncbi:MAG: TIGR00730 family Rossman fold protein [Acidobacteriota bacterium]|nr:TIGR00730 family Rossman fold protein [Acidobacteriota bacterium]
MDELNRNTAPETPDENNPPQSTTPASPVRPGSHRAPLAYENEPFLRGPDGRPLRILAEYAEPLARFRREKIQDTVVFFGSARFRSLSKAEEAVELLARPGSAEPAPDHEQKAYRAQRAVDMAHYYEDARALAHKLTEWSRTLGGKRHRFVVTTGGGPGIMEAANRGAREAGGKTIGLNIALPFEQVPNPYITPELNFEFHYFFMRKLWFAYLAKALVVFPGGFGTLDEMFEILTLAQTEKLAKKMTVLLYGEEYWRKVINLEALADAGTIAPQDVNLFQYVDSPEEAFKQLQESLIRDHLQSPPQAKRHQPEIASTRR